MTSDERAEPDFAALGALDVETEVLFDVLSDARRRFVLACLQEYATPMALGDVADELATWEHDAEITDIPAEEVRSIYVSLYHLHVPKMADAGLVEYSQERDAVALAEDNDELTALVDFPSLG